jgi:hypothetical protein
MNNSYDIKNGMSSIVPTINTIAYIKERTKVISDKITL